MVKHVDKSPQSGQHTHDLLLDRTPPPTSHALSPRAHTASTDTNHPFALSYMQLHHVHKAELIKT